MASDPEVIRVMEAALRADEGNLALRSHLAGLLVEDRPAEALKHAQTVLQSEPTHREALETAVKAARSQGQKTLADGYEKLLQALRWQNAEGMVDSGTFDPFDDDDEDELDGPKKVLSSGGDPAERGKWLDVEAPKTTLTEVAGMLEVKKRLEMAFLAPLRNPELRKMYGKSLRGGLLLYGPPGCGKTYIARALAGEMGMKFISIGLDDVLDPYFGASEQKLAELFHEARRIQPVVLFFDELDALGRKRSLMREAYGGKIVNQLLAEMDGVEAENEGLFIVAATNHPWDVDSALRRPGRFDRVVFVPPPDAMARRAIAQMSLADRPNAGIDFERIAKETENFSGADMTHLVESASEFALEAAIETGNVRPISMADFQRALREVKTSVRPWFDTAKNYAIYANDGGSYDALVQFMRERKLL